jgi:hypothetical protein
LCRFNKGWLNKKNLDIIAQLGELVRSAPSGGKRAVMSAAALVKLSIIESNSVMTFIKLTIARGRKNLEGQL